MEEERMTETGIREENGAQDEARRMSREDVRGYDGITLSQDGTEDAGSGERGEAGGVRFYSFNLSEAPLWKKILLLCLAGVAMAGFFLVAGVFMVGALAVAGVAALLYYLKRAFT